MANMSQITVLDTIQGSSVLVIQATMEVLQRHNLDLTQYKIDVVREGDSVVVICTGKDGPAGTRESFAVRHGSEVAMNAHDLGLLTANMSQLTVLDTIHGSSVLAVQAAMEVFQRYNPDLAQYKIDVVREGNSVVVIFTDKDRQVGTRGNLSARPGFEVELNAHDLHVLRSNFVR